MSLNRMVRKRKYHWLHLNKDLKAVKEQTNGYLGEDTLRQTEGQKSLGQEEAWYIQETVSRICSEWSVQEEKYQMRSQMEAR